MNHVKQILVTGATGYVGGRLVPRLLERGYQVRCLVRDPARLQGRPWVDQVEVVTGDLLLPDTITPAMRGISVAYYLVHGLQGGQVNADRDIVAARNFAQAAEEAKIEQTIYLSELANPNQRLSAYLRSRHETGNILRLGKVPVTEFRAGMIVGSGSVLFEMIRYLTEREPVLICPRWFFTLAQPIAIRNILDYLTHALDIPKCIGKLIEIGGTDRLTYADMLMGYARQRGLKRLLVPTPVYAPRFSAYWVHMVTPIHWRTVLPLIEGLHAESLVRDSTAKELFPKIRLIGYEEAVRLALGRVQSDDVETSWRSALVTTQGDITPVTLTVQEGMMIEHRRQLVDLLPNPVYRSFTGLGGARGWLYMNWAWEVRGWLDKLFGGVGLRRGRRHPDKLWVGESLDFWRVEALQPDRMMRLRAEMKLPGKAWLEFESTPQDKGTTLLTQTAYFAPKGLSGFFYWYSLYPIHTFIFRGMIQKVAQRAEQLYKVSKD